MKLKKTKHQNVDEDYWLSVSDLMAGLMVVFLFISISYMKEIKLERDEIAIERDKVKDVAVAYQDNLVSIYNALNKEFKDDLQKWDAELDEDDLSFTFKSPETLFDINKATLKQKYKEILEDFFPRYLEIILKFNGSINEIRIEGHTDSQWFKSTKDEAYFQNMRLSQERTRSVLYYVYRLKKVEDHKNWMRTKIAAVGFSSSKIIFNDITKKEDCEASRRVTFRVITNAGIQIRKILDTK